MDSIKEQIFQLENDLIKSEVRKSAEKINEILSNVENCILATYRVIKHDELDERKRYSLRSSLWTEENGKWKMSFHQGTLLAGKEGRSIF